MLFSIYYLGEPQSHATTRAQRIPISYVSLTRGKNPAWKDYISPFECYSGSPFTTVWRFFEPERPVASCFYFPGFNRYPGCQYRFFLLYKHRKKENRKQEERPFFQHSFYFCFDPCLFCISGKFRRNKLFSHGMDHCYLIEYHHISL